MDFGEILDEWDKSRKKSVQKSGNSRYRSDMERWLDTHEVTPKEPDMKKGLPVVSGNQGRESILRMEPQRQLDLHGFTSADAEEEVDRFIRESHSRGAEKVRVITGKGLHSAAEPVLQKTVRLYLEKSALCGEFGYENKKNGGRGAFWVLLRYRSR